MYQRRPAAPRLTKGGLRAMPGYSVTGPLGPEQID
jgi:hypothetical protein